MDGRRCVAQRSNCADRTASFRWKQRQFRRKTGWVLWRTRSKNRAEIRKNEFSFPRNRRYFSCVFCNNSSPKKRGQPRQNRRIICDFSSKKAANTPPETLEKIENTHLIYINFICQWAFRSTNCIAVLSAKLPHAAAPPLDCDRVIFLLLHNQIDKENYFCVSFFDCHTVSAGHLTYTKNRNVHLGHSCLFHANWNFFPPRAMARCGLHGLSTSGIMTMKTK